MVSMHDLPDEIHQLIAKLLQTKTLYSLIRASRACYSAYIPCLWSNHTKHSTIDAALFRKNAHLVETVMYSEYLSEEYYSIIFPRLHTLRLQNASEEGMMRSLPSVQLAQKVSFMRHHFPFLRKLVYFHDSTLPRQFWEIADEEWIHLECLEFSGVVEEGAEDAFWRVCDRVKTLYLRGPDFPKRFDSLSALSFLRLEQLRIADPRWKSKSPYRAWPLALLEQVKKSPGLRQLRWDLSDTSFPAQMVHDALAEGFWPALCELSIRDWEWTDQDLATILRTLPSRRMTDLDCTDWDKWGPATFNCLRELHFVHLRELKLDRCVGVTSAMTQEMLVECVHLVHFEAPYVFVEDVATSPKPWGCLKLEDLTTYIAKKPEDEPAWDGLVFEQISKLRRLRSLDLQRSQYLWGEKVCLKVFMELAPLDLRLGSSSRSKGFSSNSGIDEREGVRGCGEGGGADIRCWSSLVQMEQFLFTSDRQTLGMEEALWMSDHWKALVLIYGDFRGVDEGDLEKLDQLFIEKGIQRDFSGE